ALSSRIFFFQAEDGIRYLTVTGVQTCALPICSQVDWLRHVLAVRPAEKPPHGGHHPTQYCPTCGRSLRRHGVLRCDTCQVNYEQIGRASCRERVWFSVDCGINL